jgi:hypothetical protein
MTTREWPLSLPVGLAVAGLLAIAAVLVGRQVVTPSEPVVAEPSPRSSSSGGPALRPAAAPDPRVAEGLAVLRRWDERRAAAYGSGDARALRRLYAPGSEAGVADVRLLRSYAERGLAVRDMVTQLLAVEPVLLRERRLVLRVRDRLVGATATGRATEVALPADRPSTRVVTLERGATGWRVSAVRPG